MSTAYAPSNFWMAHLLFSQSSIEAHEHFQKQTHRNRTKILGPNGVQVLSIPVMGDSKNAPVQNVRISYAENWQQVHWRSLQAAYGNAPYWEFLSVELAPIYNTPTPTLWDFNQKIIALFLDWLQVEKALVTTQTFEKQYLDALNYRVAWPINQMPPYQQFFAEPNTFVPDMSFFDLIFNLGPQAYDYLYSAYQNIIALQNTQ